MTTPQKTILVVEDEDEIGSNMNRALSQRGYRVLRAKDAEEALTISEQDQPAIILTDFDLPTLDSMLHRIRAHQSLKDMLVAVIDIDHSPEPPDGLKILRSFDELEQLLGSSR